MARSAGITINSRKLQKDARKMQRALQKLGKESRQRSVIRRSLGPATTPMNKAAKSKAPVGETGQYRKSIGKKTQQYKASGSVIVVIGPRTGFKTITADGSPHDPANIGHLLEFGHGGPHPAPPIPHLRPAYESKKATAQRIFADRFWGNFRKELRRVRAK